MSLPVLYDEAGVPWPEGTLGYARLRLRMAFEAFEQETVKALREATTVGFLNIFPCLLKRKEGDIRPPGCMRAYPPNDEETIAP